MQDYAQAREDAYYSGDLNAIEMIVDAEAAGVPLTYEVEPERERKGTIHYINPGGAAIEYALEHLSETTREQAAQVIRRLLAEPSSEKRVKRCDYCGYPWRDSSLRNTKRTCSDECKTALKSLQKARQRADKALLTGKKKKPTKRDTSYVWWLEYPFWLDEYEMLKQTWKHEVSYDDTFLDFIHGQNETYGVGNRKVKPQSPGAEDEKAGRKFNAWTIGKMRGK